MNFKKTLKVFAASVLLFGSVGLATSCEDTNTTTDVAGMILNQNGKVVRADFDLAKAYKGCALTWSSSNEGVAKINVAEDGTITCKITRPSSRTEVTLTAKSGKYSKDYTIIVPAIDADEVADEFKFTHDKKVLKSGTYDLPTTASYSGVSANISWSISEEYKELATISEGKLIVTAQNDIKDEIQLIAEFTVGSESTKKSYTVYTMNSTTIINTVSQLEVGKPYILYVNHTSKSTDYFFTGVMSGYYGATETDIAKGWPIYVEEVTGGYHLTFTDAAGKKQFINCVVSGKYVNFKVEDNASSVWTWDETYNTVKTVCTDEKTYYIGCTTGYATLQPFEDPAANHPLTFATIESAITTPQENVDYNLVMNQTNVDKILYSLGNVPDGSYYASTTEDISKSVPYRLEKSGEGWKISVTVNGAKKYMNAVQSGTYVNVKFEDTGSTVYKWNEQYNTLTVVIDGTEYFFGTSQTYTTMGFYKIDEIETDFYGYFTYQYNHIIVNEDEDNKDDENNSNVNIVTSPQVDTEYKLFIDQKQLGKELYFTGTMSGNFGASSSNSSEGVIVKLETNGSGYNIYFMDGSTKKYISAVDGGTNNKGNQLYNMSIGDSSSSVWVWNSEYNTLTTTVLEETVYLGTYGDYTTFSCSKISYAATSYPANLVIVDKNDSSTGDNTGSGDSSNGSGDASNGSGDASNGSGDSSNEVTLITIQEALDKEEGTEVIIEGKITAVGNGQYTISDDSGSIIIYGTIAEIGDKTLAVGDTIKVKGTRSIYKPDWAQTPAQWSQQIIESTLLSYVEGPKKEALVYSDINFTATSTMEISGRTGLDEDSFSTNYQKWSLDGIVLENEKASSANDVYQKQNDSATYVRVYKDSNVKISSETKFKAIKITFSAKNNALQASDLIENANFAISEDELTCIIILDEESTSFSLNVLPRQFRICSISLGTIAE